MKPGTLREFDRLTEGAQRALSEAVGIAGSTQATLVDTQHLLWGLTLGESLASELLLSLDVSSASVTETLFVIAEDQTTEPMIPSGFHATLEKVVYVACRQASRWGQAEEVGTEALLWALTDVDSEVQTWLKSQGVTGEIVLEGLGRTEKEAQPLDVDFELNMLAPQSQSETEVLRILDASANRCREGLRVLEDYVRFSLDDAHLSGLLKTARHRLVELLSQLDPTGRIAARETQYDVGTGLRTPSERQRLSLVDVLKANTSRVEESLRSLEEYSKIIHPQTAGELEQLRYHCYTIAKALLLTEHNQQRLQEHQLYLLATEKSCRFSCEYAVQESLAGGVNIVQLREKEKPDRELLTQAKAVREWTRQRGALFIMNDRPDLAVLSQADGVHVGQEELSVKQARQIIGPQRLIGVSTHTIEQARQAVLDGADYLGVGPVFPSATKQFDQFAGLDFVREVAAEITLPWYAIGGITTENLPQVLDAGATRVAVSAAILQAEQPRETAREFQTCLQTQRNPNL